MGKTEDLINISLQIIGIVITIVAIPQISIDDNTKLLLWLGLITLVIIFLFKRVSNVFLTATFQLGASGIPPGLSSWEPITIVDIPKSWMKILDISYQSGLALTVVLQNNISNEWQDEVIIKQTLSLSRKRYELKKGAYRLVFINSNDLGTEVNVIASLRAM